MGAKQSTAHDSHFSKETARAPPPDMEDDLHHISISTKMVERLVEEALANSPPQTKPPRPRSPPQRITQNKHNLLSDKLRELDESHSQKVGLTKEDIRAIARRIAMRTGNTLSTRPVCQECEQRVVRCYESSADPTQAHQCWDAVDEFTRCVEKTTSLHLRKRLLQDEQRTTKRRRANAGTARVRLVPATRLRASGEVPV